MLVQGFEHSDAYNEGSLFKIASDVHPPLSPPKCGSEVVCVCWLTKSVLLEDFEHRVPT